MKKIDKIKKYLIAIGLIFFVLIYVRLAYLVLFMEDKEIHYQLGVYSYGAHTALGWFLSLTVGLVVVFVVWAHGLYLKKKNKNS